MNMRDLDCCPPSFNRQPIIITGNCNSIILEIFFPPQNQALFYKFSNQSVESIYCKRLVFYIFLVLCCVTFSKEKWGKRKCNKTCATKLKSAGRNLLNIARFSFLSPCLFWGFQGEITACKKKKKTPAGIFIKKERKMKRKHVALGGLILYFPWLSHSWRRTEDHWDWANGAA